MTSSGRRGPIAAATLTGRVPELTPVAGARRLPMQTAASAAVLEPLMKLLTWSYQPSESS